MSRSTRKHAGIAAAVVAAVVGTSLMTTLAIRARGGAPGAATAITSAVARMRASADAAMATAAATAAPLVVTPSATAGPAVVTPSATAAPAAPAAPAVLAIPTSADSLPGHVVTSTLNGHTVLVYVPGAYSALPAASFPVVYFLHGSPGSADDWISGGHTASLLDQLIAAGQLPPVIAVIPDDQGTVADDSYWGNTALGDTVETWFVTDLVPNVDSTYRTLGAAYRGIAGLSAGGFGAVNLALHHPGLFSWVASYSGVFTGPSRLFGSQSAANSPQLTVSSLPAAERFPLFLGQGAQDTEFGPETTQFVATVDGLGWAAPLKTEVVPGPHGWQAWAVEDTDSLIWLGQLWGRA